MLPPGVFNDPQPVKHQRRTLISQGSGLHEILPWNDDRLLGHEKCVVCLQRIYLRVKIGGTDTKR